MKKFRLSVAFLLLALVLAAVPAFAQDSTFGASEEDYALWSAAGTALTAGTASFDFTAEFSSVTGDEETDQGATIEGSGVFDLTDPENPVLRLDATAEGMIDGEEQTRTLNLVILDGFAYSNTGDGWEQRTLEDALGNVSEEMGMPEMGSMNPSDITKSPMSMFDDIEGADQFFSLERSDEDGLALLSFSVDIPGLISSPEVAGFVVGLLGMGSAEDMSEENLAQMTQMFAMMFGEAELTFDEYIDPASQTVSRAVFEFSLPLEAMMGTPGAGIDLSFDANFTGHGEPVTVEAPEGATMVEAEADS